MRPDRDLYFMEVAHVIRKRSTCTRGSVGAVAVMDRRIIATGYNGSPPGAPHCTELGCLVSANHHEAGCQRTLHAEANLIAWAARTGQATLGATLYCTHGPCLNCAKLILSAGFSKLLYGVPYRLSEGIVLISDYIEVEQFDQEYVQALERRHEAPLTAAEEQGEEALPTECQTAEGQAYGESLSRAANEWYKK